jgi:hypothetical protein
MESSGVRTLVGDVARQAAPGIPNTRLVGDVAGKRSERGSICFGENAKRLPVQSGSKGASRPPQVSLHGPG